MLSEWKDGVKRKRWAADPVLDWECRELALFAKYANKDGAPFFFRGRALFKSLDSELSSINSCKLAGLSPNRFGPGIPGRDCVFEIGVIGQMAADGRMVAEVFVLEGWLAGSNCVEEVRLVRGNVAVTIAAQ